MFGSLRITLSLMVMLYHLFVPALPLGAYAVFGFYIISGYLMTTIMHESYGYTGQGRSLFAVNRFLRLYPQYWAALAFSFFLVLNIDPAVVHNFHKSMYIPASGAGYIYNLFMIFPSLDPGSIDPRLVPPTWSITVEISFYVLICLGVSRTFTRTKIWIGLSICYVVATFILGLPWGDRYSPIAAASLPFSVGSLIYFMKENVALREFCSKMRLSSTRLFILMLGNCLTWIVISTFKVGRLMELGFYLNLVIAFLLVYSISTGGRIVPMKASMDKLVGDFSYPIYLLHWQCGLLTSFLMFGEGVHEFSGRGLLNVTVSLLLVSTLSFLLILIIDKPIDLIRKKVRKASINYMNVSRLALKDGNVK